LSRRTPDAGFVKVTFGDLPVKNSLEITYFHIRDVKPSPHAARRHTQQQRRKLKSLLTKFGQVTPIILDGENCIVDGHAVYETLCDLGYDEIAVVVVPNRSEADIRALRLALNRLPQDTEWNDELLRAEFEALISLGFDLELTGFDAIEIDMALSIDAPTANTVEEGLVENLEPSAASPVTRLGDIWRLGHHIVGCGDARDGDLLRVLVGKRQVAAVFTDPPYNLYRHYLLSSLDDTRHREFVMGSGETRAEFVEFLASSIGAVKQMLVDGAILFLCTDWRHAVELLEAAARHDLEPKNLCIWVKSNAGMGSIYRSEHELVFVFKHGPASHQNNFGPGEHGRSRSNVWQYRGVNAFGKLGAHPTVKPVRMIADAIRDVSRRGQLVADPFLGSGSTLIAAQETGRVCVGIELDPAYIDVAIRRWQRRTGKDAINAVTGDRFDDAAQRTTSEAKPESQRAPIVPRVDEISDAVEARRENGEADRA
jgi:DNA modification methylase